MSLTRHYPMIAPLYRMGYLQTLWNAAKPINRQEGWTVKNGMWVPRFFNMRPAADSPELFSDVCMSMAELTAAYPDVNLLTAVEMAGLLPAGGTSIFRTQMGLPVRMAYTRPLPHKARKPEDVVEILRNLPPDVAGYGEKGFVEGRMKSGDNIAIFDDMATDLGSKLIARLIVLWQAEQLDIPVTCDTIFYFLNWNVSTKQKIAEFPGNPNLDLKPAKLTVDYVIEFEEAMPLLEGVMDPAEYRVISDFQSNPEHFQDKDVQKEVLALANAA